MNKISLDETENDKTKIRSVSQDGNTKEESYDYVLIALPIHNRVSQLELDFPTAVKLSPQQMQQTNTYFVFGQLNLFPQIPLNRRIELFSVEPSLPFRSIATQLPCDFSKRKDSELFVKSPRKLYKVFSDRELGQTDWDQAFASGYDLVKFTPWLAYPKYGDKIDFENVPPIVLDGEKRSRVLYLNALEWCASCMEMECVAARNLSILVANNEKERVKKRRFFPNKSSFFSATSSISILLAVIVISNFISFYFKSN